MYEDERSSSRQRDLVLATNEFCFLQNLTTGIIRSHVGPLTMATSQQETLVVFNTDTKRFEAVEDFKRAKQLFVTAPEGWYVTLKNPTTDLQFPEPGKANNPPSTVKIGVKINIAGPVSFALFPGQMAKVIQGHKLRSNQYLLARIYDADAIKDSDAKVATRTNDGARVAKPTNGEETKEEKEPKNVKAAEEETATKQETAEYSTGQLLVIKGTDVSFYMPPTGIEVVPNEDGSYVREAVTLERLNYAILKDEDGEKRYVHGPAVVFPKPTETFVKNADGSPIFRAKELSPISGIYVKVIAPYKDEDGTEHKLGEELFITGDDKGQKIYYPRPEHSIISYGDKVMHYAIAIPAGEGRYVLNRATGKITTVRGPKMFLPDPRTQVIVKRVLTRSECRLLYPNNDEVLRYNDQLRENSAFDEGALEVAPVSEPPQSNHSGGWESIRRETTFTKPRTITLDTKFEGVVSVDVWTGYAINVVSKTGKRQVVVGPTTRLLEYDETVEALHLSTGKPKTTDYLETVAFLRVDNNKVSDIIEAQTSDFVNVRIKVSYVVDFLREHQDKWFNVENYVKFLCDRERTAIKKAVKGHSIQELQSDLIDIVTLAALDEQSSGKDHGRLFEENGMLVKDVEVLELRMDTEIEELVMEHQEEMIRESLELIDAEGHLDLQKKLAEVRIAVEEIKANERMKALKLESEYELSQIQADREAAEKKAEAKKAATEAEKALQEIFDAINAAELARKDAAYLQDVKHRKKDAEIEESRRTSYAATVEKIMSSIQPDLVAALTAKANAQILTDATSSMAPWAIAKDESVPETINKLLRGTTLEHVIETIGQAGDAETSTESHNAETSIESCDEDW